MLVVRVGRRMLVNAQGVHRVSVNVPVQAAPRRGVPAVVVGVVVAAAVAVEVAVTADGASLASAMF
jgi:hypothetical protein